MLGEILCTSLCIRALRDTYDYYDRLLWSENIFWFQNLHEHVVKNFKFHLNGCILGLEVITWQPLRRNKQEVYFFAVLSTGGNIWKPLKTIFAALILLQR